MKTNNLFIVLATTFLLSGGNLLRAADDSAPPQRGHLLHRLADQLQLTPDQRKQIKTIVAADKSTLRPLVQEMRAARKDLRATIQTGNTSEAAVRAAAAKVAAIEADLAVERMKLFAQIAPILTDAQKQQLATIE